MNLSEMIRRQQRRTFLGQVGRGVGSIALASLLGGSAARGADSDSASAADRWTGVLDKPHHAPRAKRVIFLVQAGGMSHLETFDHKPKLAELDGQAMPKSYTEGQPIDQL